MKWIFSCLKIVGIIIGLYGRDLYTSKVLTSQLLLVNCYCGMRFLHEVWFDC